MGILRDLSSPGLEEMMSFFHNIISTVVEQQECYNYTANDGDLWRTRVTHLRLLN